MCDNIQSNQFYCNQEVASIDNNSVDKKLEPLVRIADTLYLAPQPKNTGDFEVKICLMSRKGISEEVFVREDLSFIQYVPFTLSMPTFEEYREAHSDLETMEALSENLILAVAQYLSLELMKITISSDMDKAFDFMIKNTVPYLADIEIDKENKKIYLLVTVVVNPEYAPQYSLFTGYKASTEKYSFLCEKLKGTSPFLNRFKTLHFTPVEEVVSNESNNIK